jgi:hypothetical protein
MKKSKTAPATNERFAVVWNWESDMKILYIENTFDEALAKFKKKLKPFLKDNEGIEGKFDMETYIKEHQDQCSESRQGGKIPYMFDYNDGEMITIIQKIKV